MPKLHPHIGVPGRKPRVLPLLATIAILLVVEGLNVSAFPGIAHSKPAGSVDANHVAPMVGGLSTKDAALYRNAFLQQQAGHEDEADAAVAQVANPLLKGVLLAERYLTPGYEPNFDELSLWLTHYGDHAQASDLYRLARAATPDDSEGLAEPAANGVLKGFSNGHDRSALVGKKHWTAGLAAFRKGDMHNASAHFKTLLLEDEGYLSSDDYAAVSFWAYRAALGTGEQDKAMQYLTNSAAQQPSFYSILARQIVGSGLLASSQGDTGDISAFMQKPAVCRAIALKAIGQDALAEKELRAMFPSSSFADRRHLVQLAATLNLPAAQIRMATASHYDTKEGAQYPMPHWTPTAGYRVEPALLFAIMRQESGFNPNAKSASGALGVMQLMPATAHAMARDARMAASHEPAASMALGQQYLEHLMELSSINDNLIFIVGAYNAGPGTMLSWQKSLHAIDDPLLFVESIPSASARDYIVHVMGNYWVYSEMLGGDQYKSVQALVQSHWPRYEREGSQMVAMISHLSVSVEGAE